MSVAGTYECVTKTPMGDQKSEVTINVDGDTFTGSNVGAMGSMELENGKVDGNNVTWSAKISSPMPLTLDFTGTVEGDKLSGSVKAGSFGSFPFTGNRTA